MSRTSQWVRAALTVVVAALLASVATASQATETITYIHWDALGSPVAATDEAGNVVWREAYRPYGQRINNEAASAANSRWYTGHPQDADTGLVYAGARYYDPVVGRFLGTDSVGVQEGKPQSFNRYAYASNGPYRYVDPDGRFVVQAIIWGITLGWTYHELTKPVPLDEHGDAPLVEVPTFPGPIRGLGLGGKIGKQLFERGDDVVEHVIKDKRARKIFSGRRGHLPDTSQNRSLLKETADDPKTTLGTDRHGNTWSAKTLDDGTQVWTQTRDGEIINGGLNRTPRSYDPRTGLSSPGRPNWK